MKKWLFVTIICLLMPTSVLAQAQEFTFTKTAPATNNGPLISRPRTYDSQPSAIQEGDVLKVWYCGGNGTHDSIFYTAIKSNGEVITPPQLAVWSSLNPAFDDGDHTCDVTVIKHQHPALVSGASQYKMWYECAPLTYRKSDSQFQSSFTQICHAVSDDGISWRKFELLDSYNFRFNALSLTDSVNYLTNATAVITLPQAIKNNLGMERRENNKLYVNDPIDYALNYGVGHPTAITSPPDANGYQKVQLWYYDSAGSWNERAMMYVESSDGFHFTTPVKTNLQSVNKIKYVNVPVGGHAGFYFATLSGSTNFFNYSWDGINWFWGDAYKDPSFYTGYLTTNFNLGSVTGCPAFGNNAVADIYGRIGSLSNIFILSTEGGRGTSDGASPGDTCYNAAENSSRGYSWDLYYMMGNLNYVGSTATPTPIPATATPIPTAASTSTPTPTTATVPGDLNGDGHVNLQDYNMLIGAFGNPYTLSDYNTLIGNFGR